MITARWFLSWSSPRLQQHDAVERKIHLSQLFKFARRPHSRAANTLMKSVEVNWLPWTIRVEYLGRAAFRQRFLHSFYAKISLQRDRHPPCQNAPVEPIPHSREIDEPARHPLPGRRLRSNLPRGGM